MSKRRGRGEGSIEQMPNGTFKARMSYVDAAGKRHQPTAYFETMRDARKWLHDQHTKADQGQLRDASRLSVGQWLDKWLAIKRGTVAPNTQLFYEDKVRLYLRPYLARIPLAKLQADHI